MILLSSQFVKICLHPQKSLAKDFDPKEIVNSGIFSLKGAQNSMKKLAAGDLQSFGQDLLDALVPSPDKLGAVMAVSRVSFCIFRFLSCMQCGSRTMLFCTALVRIYHVEHVFTVCCCLVCSLCTVQGVAQKEAVKNIVAEATSTGFLDQIASAKARGRRASRYVYCMDCAY